MVDAQGPKGKTLFVLAHGAGGTMDAPLLVEVQAGLVAAGHAAARFNFPYTDKGRKAPDKAPVLMQTIADVATELRTHMKPSRLILGGKSMGGRMASMLVADGFPADGLVFLGYPLHPMGKPQQLRKDHLFNIRCPMLFVSGSKDKLALLDLLEPVVAELGATLALLQGGDHSLTRGTAFTLNAIAAWLPTVPTGSRRRSTSRG